MSYLLAIESLYRQVENTEIDFAEIDLGVFDLLSADNVEWDDSFVTEEIEIQIMKECRELSDEKKKRLLAYVSMLRNIKI